MSDITFAKPWVFALLPLVPLALGAWWWGTRRAAARARQLSRVRAAPPPYLAAMLFALAVAVAIGAAAQPRWGTRESRVPRTGANLVLVIDISRSMDATDAAPNRLQAVKDTVSAVLNRLGGDRVGLVVFAGEARVRFPLTTDFTAARQVVATLQSGVLFVDGGTNASLGLEEAVKLLGEDGEAGKVILLLTDGDDLGGDPAASAQKVKDSGADLLVAGVGTAEGSTIPVVDPVSKSVKPKLDEAGQPIITRLNEPFLRLVAAAGGGRYLGSDLALVPGAVDGRLRALERSRIEERPTILPIERYQVFAGAALGLLVLAALAERFGRVSLRGAAAFAVLVLVLPGCASEAYKANEAGRDALEAGNAELAIEKFLEVQVARPDDPEVALNLAAAYFAAGRYEEAILSARRVLASNNTDLRGRAYASIGHHQFALGRLNESLDAFRRALLENPQDDASRHDYEVVLRLLFPEVEPTPTPPPVDGAGTPTPPASPGASASPGQGGNGSAIQTPVTGTPTPGGTGGGLGSPTAGTGQQNPTSLQELDRQLRNIDQEVARLLEEAGETPTAAQALEILRLLAERSRIAGLRDSLAGGGGPRDY